MRTPRDLEATLPSPSEMDNYHKCPCLWYLRDRMWIKPNSERWPLTFGKIVDDVCGAWLEKVLTTPEEAMEVYWGKVSGIEPPYEDEYFTTYAASTKDALEVWLEKYGKIAQEEEILAIQPKLKTNVNIKIDYAVRGKTGIRVRERKLMTGWNDLEEEMQKYAMGFQPICYHEKAEEYFGEKIECVEMEFLIRSVPASGKFKAKAAMAERRELFIDSWKKDLWYNSALFTNACMKMLEQSLEGETESVTFASIPRHTRNCLQKIGKKVYPCEFYHCCTTNTSPLKIEDRFTCDRKEATDALSRHSEGGTV
jgi:hypothetical protein